MADKVVIAVARGGAGKTTSATTLAAMWSDMGLRTLLCDLDPQASSTLAFGADDSLPGLFECVMDPDKYDLSEITLQPFRGKPNLHLVPASQRLSAIEVVLMSQKFGRERKLKSLLQAVEPDYDVILMDTSPASASLLNINALVAADKVIVPLEQSVYGESSLVQLKEVVDQIRENELNPALKLGAVFMTRYDPRKVETRRTEENVKEVFGPLVCRTNIRTDSVLTKVARLGVPVSIYDRRRISRAYWDYYDLALELIEKGVVHRDQVTAR